MEYFHNKNNELLDMEFMQSQLRKGEPSLRGDPNWKRSYFSETRYLTLPTDDYLKKYSNSSYFKGDVKRLIIDISNLGGYSISETPTIYTYYSYVNHKFDRHKEMRFFVQEYGEDRIIDVTKCISFLFKLPYNKNRKSIIIGQKDNSKKWFYLDVYDLFYNINEHFGIEFDFYRKIKLPASFRRA